MHKLILLYLYGLFLFAPELIQAQFSTRNVIDSNAISNRFIAAADLDSDGDIDVIGTISNMTVWYENIDGEGVFGVPKAINSGYGQSFSAASADIDNDGDNDILFTSFDDNLVLWYENLDGLGNFGPEQEISTNSMGAYYVSAADIDNDNDLDVVVGAITEDTFSWFENINSLGDFGSAQLITNNTNGRSARTEDIDGDGDLDLVASNLGPNNVNWFENIDGQGIFGLANSIAMSGSSVQSVQVADIDNDGDQDVFSAINSQGRIELFYNNGDGSFSEMNLITSNADGARSLRTSDVDSDGDLDLLSASNIDNKFSWYENLDGSFGTQQIIEEDQGVNYRSIAVADLDGDGDDDVLGAITVSQTFVWYENLFPLSVNEFSLDTVQLTPNPTSGILQIVSSNLSLDLLEVRDIQGKLLLSKATPTAEIDISSLSSGLFFVTLSKGKQKVIKRIIKK